VEEVVLADDRAVGVGEDGERVAALSGEIRRLRRGVDADRDRADAQALELRKLLLNTP
jgi:uncharacterized small protein (DUF1192 family)